MDGESSCESDISESWSLIDLNLVEPSLTLEAAEDTAYLVSPVELIKHEDDCSKDENVQSENFELMEFSSALKQANMSDGVMSSSICHLDNSPCELFHSNSSFEDISIESSHEAGLVQLINSSPEEKTKLEAYDGDSIEILHLEHKCKDTDVDTDGISVISEEECEDEKHYANKNERQREEQQETDFVISAFEKTQSTVIRKRRKRAETYFDSSDDNLNSDLVVPDRKYYSSISSSDVSNNEQLQVDVNPKRPVYRHYRNNVTNTVLSLAMGVIFAGVACIALGHFLGVHDAEQTAGEMMEALKRLQMENVALQSRLSHLSRAFFTREINSKSEPAEPDFDSRVCAEKQLNKLGKVQERLDAEEKPETKSFPISFRCLQPLSKLKNLIGDKKFVNNGEVVAVDEIVSRIHGRLSLLSELKPEKEKLKRFEELDSKIAKLAHKFSNNFLTSRINLENLLTKLTKLSEKLNKKLCRNFPDLMVEGSRLNCDSLAGKQRKERVPGELNLFQWYPTEEENKFDVVSLSKPEEGSEPVLYNFPQQQEFYQNASTGKEMKCATESSPISCDLEPFWCKRDSHESKDEKVNNNTSSENKEFVQKKKKQKDYKKNKIKLGYKKFEYKTKPKKEFYKKKMKSEKQKNYRKEKPKKMKPIFRFKSEELRKIKNFSQNEACGAKCLNVTGEWVFKMAKGREQCRKHRWLSNWQFERAKAREELRDVTENWQIARAHARETDRDDARWYFRRYLARNHHRRGFSPETFSWI